MSKKHEKQFLALTHVYMCNSILCIYNNRNPIQILDIMDDNTDWFEIKIPKIQSIVRNVSSKHSHGWIRVDVILTNPDTPIERWYFIHTPLSDNDKLQITEQLKYKTYYDISMRIKSIHSLLNCMPAKMLSLSLERMKNSQREIRIELVPLSDFPVDEQEVQNAEYLTLNELVTPIGNCSVRCVYDAKPELLIPKIIKKEELTISDDSRNGYITPEKSRDILTDSCEELDVLIDSMIKSESSEKIVCEVVPMTINEFAKLAINTKFEENVKKKDDIIGIFNKIKVEADELLSEWSRSG